jgi:hypothetical protein
MLLFRAKQLYKKIHDECLHSGMYFSIKLFGGYATPRKHAVFSRLGSEQLPIH